jgi:WXXGXW repeat (2 copies)
MRLFRSVRWLLLAMLVCVVPASSYAGVFISVNFAPPVLPVYVQPVCPAPNLIWTPGYWGYGPDGYYWIPGAWVPAPYPGGLWTPGYWGWSSGLYVFHPGYWGLHVGYYGGVNYGGGYLGIGFAGGEWRGGVFAYNTAVVHVNTTVVHTTFVDRTVIQRYTVANPNHVAFAGGPGGVNHPAAPEERIAEHESHMASTSFQAQHEAAARADRTSYAKANGGHPTNFAAARPLGAESHPAPAARPAAPMGANRGAPNAGGYRPNTAAAPRAPNAAAARQEAPARGNNAQPRGNAAPPKPAAKPRPEGHER